MPAYTPAAAPALRVIEGSAGRTQPQPEAEARIEWADTLIAVGEHLTAVRDHANSALATVVREASELRRLTTPDAPISPWVRRALANDLPVR